VPADWCQPPRWPDGQSVFSDAALDDAPAGIEPATATVLDEGLTLGVLAPGFRLLVADRVAADAALLGGVAGWAGNSGGSMALPSASQRTQRRQKTC
jgi:hypothetical protein